MLDVKPLPLVSIMHTISDVPTVPHPMGLVVRLVTPSADTIPLVGMLLVLWFAGGLRKRWDGTGVEKGERWKMEESN